MRFINSLPKLSLLAAVIAMPVLAKDIPLGAAVESDEIVTKVVSVDASEHRIVVEGSDSKPVTIQLSDAAQDLGHLKAGDHVATLVVHSIAFDLNTDVQSQAPGSIEMDGVERATANNPHPGGAAFRMARVQLKIMAVDPKKNQVVLEGPAGALKTVTVEKPEIRAKLKDLKVGETVLVTYKDTLQIVTEQGR